MSKTRCPLCGGEHEPDGTKFAGIDVLPCPDAPLDQFVVFRTVAPPRRPSWWPITGPKPESAPPVLTWTCERGCGYDGNTADRTTCEVCTRGRGD